MAAPDKYTRRRAVGSYISTVISMTLVLFMLGLIGLIILNANKLSRHVKENITVSVILKSDMKEVDIAKLQKELELTSYVKRAEHIDKDKAAEALKKDLGEDFVEFLGYNPLLASIELYLHAEYANNDSIAWIEEDLKAVKQVKEVYYQKDLITLVNENIRKISLILLGFSGLLLLIAIALINNSIRLSIYSKRFLIRSMQLVGATQSFIRRPFVLTGVFNGLISSILAILMLSGLMYLAQKEIPQLSDFEDMEMVMSLYGVVTLLGIIISWLSTLLAVTKYLKMKPENLY